MKIEICLNLIKPISLNHSTKITTRGKFASKYKTDSYKQLESAINLQMRKYKNELNKFNNKYSETKHYLVAEYRYYYPILIKAGNRISKKSGDTSNNIKVIEDCVFKHLMADDSQVISLQATKIHSNDIRTEITLELKDLKYIC